MPAKKQSTSFSTREMSLLRSNGQPIAIPGMNAERKTNSEKYSGSNATAAMEKPPINAPLPGRIPSFSSIEL
jgi:hypothetical protein